jgi:hypothetical protein
MSFPIPTLKDVVKGRFQRPRPDSEASLIDESVNPILQALVVDKREMHLFW